MTRTRAGRNATSHHTVGIGPWERMTMELLLAVVESCNGDLGRAATKVGMSTTTMQSAFAEANAVNLPQFYAAVQVEVQTDLWKRMLARMLLAVVDEAPTIAGAAAVLGLRRSALRGRVRRARRLLSSARHRR